MKREIKFRAWNEKTGMEYDIYPPVEVPIMQYTGLKDKNGVEIYEGDVVKTSRYIGVVEFISGSFIIKWTDGKTGFRAPELRNSIKPEVIGNIYENPELL